jgi:hypothetical protein
VSSARFVIASALLIAACDSGGGKGSNPDAPEVDAYFSTCGHPGDVGNEMGVGKFCASIGDCTNQSAPLCSSLGDRTTHFCTHTCRSTDPAGACGTGAECTCNASNQCGCTPSACLN